MTNLLELPNTIKKNGFAYELEIANGKVAIYRQVDLERGNLVGFEIFRIRFRESRELNGRQLKASLRFPHDEAFGYWAWFAKTRNEAYSKMFSLINNG